MSHARSYGCTNQVGSWSEESHIMWRYCTGSLTAGRVRCTTAQNYNLHKISPNALFFRMSWFSTGAFLRQMANVPTLQPAAEVGCPKEGVYFILNSHNSYAVRCPMPSPGKEQDKGWGPPYQNAKLCSLVAPKVLSTSRSTCACPFIIS